MFKCNHVTENSSVFQTLDELDFERGIWFAAQNNDIAKVKDWILKKDVNAVDSYGYTALHYASRNGHFEICHLLISNGANVNALTASGKASSLHRCASMGHSHIFNLLLNAGALIDLKDEDGKTVLHRAVEGDNVDIVETIMRINPSLLKEPDKKGYTPKHYVCNKSQQLINIINSYNP